MSGLSSRYTFVLQRLTWGTIVLWGVLTATWLLIASLPESRMVGWGNVEMGFSAAYETPPGPLALYIDWMTRLLTLEWGQSVYYEKPVLDVYATRLPVTMTYLVPGVLVSTLLGSGLSTYTATNRASPLDRVLSVASNIGLSVPTFVLAFVTLTFMSTTLGWIRIYDLSLP